MIIPVSRKYNSKLIDQFSTYVEPDEEAFKERINKELHNLIFELYLIVKEYQIENNKNH